MRPTIHIYHSIYNVQKKHLTSLASPSNLHLNLLSSCKEYLTRFVIRFCQNQTRIIASIQNFQYSTAKKQGSSISTVNRLWARRPRKRGSIPARGKSVHVPSGVHPASCSMGTGGSFPSVKLGAHLHLVLTSTMNSHNKTN